MKWIKVAVDMLAHVLLEAGYQVLLGFVGSDVVTLLCACVGVVGDNVVEGVAQTLRLDLLVDVHRRFKEIKCDLDGRVYAVFVGPDDLTATNKR